MNRKWPLSNVPKLLQISSRPLHLLKSLCKNIISRLSLTNVLLSSILLVVYFGFYYGSDRFRLAIHSIGVSYIHQKYSKNFTCITGNLSQREYESIKNEMRVDIASKEAEAKIKYGTINTNELIKLRLEYVGLIGARPISYEKLSIYCTRLIKYMFGRKVFESETCGEIPSTYRNCH